MPRKKREKPYELPPAYRTLSASARTYLVSDRRLLSPIQQLVASDPQLNNQFLQLGGFERVLTQEERLSFSSELLNEFSNLQANWQLNNFLGPDVSRISTVQTLEEELKEIKKKTTKVATHLDDCCNEIKRLLNTLLTDLEKQSEKTRSLILARINTLLGQILDALQLLSNSLDEKIAPITTSLHDLTEKINYFIERIYDRDVTFIKRKLDVITAAVNDLKTEILTALNARFDLIEGSLIEVNAVLAGIEFTLSAIEGTASMILTTLIGTAGELTTLVTGEFFALKAKVSTLEERLNKSINAIPDTISSVFQNEFTPLKEDIQKSQKQIKQDIADYKAALQQELEETFKQYQQKIAIEVASTVVGESYSRFDSISSYYACLTFVFNEPILEGLPRRSQIKVRVSKKIGWGF